MSVFTLTLHFTDLPLINPEVAENVYAKEKVYKLLFLSIYVFTPPPFATASETPR